MARLYEDVSARSSNAVEFLPVSFLQETVMDPQRCPGPDCTHLTANGDLCHSCSTAWMRLRDEAVKEAEHLTELAAQFRLYCVEQGHPDPYHD